MAEGARVKGCLKFGCFGCAGLVALVMLVSILLSIIVALRDDTVTIEERNLDQEIPRQADLPETVEDFGDPMSDIVQGFRLDGYDVDEPGRIVLDLSAGEFEIVPGPPDQPAHVEAVFDSNRYRLDQTYETWGESGWTYEVKFGVKSWLSMLGQNGNAPKVRIVIPRDRPFVLEAKIGMGQSHVELGGLWVLDADVEFGMGSHSLGFSEPLAAPMNNLIVSGSMGEVRVREAGNASPEVMQVGHSMGELLVDLRGAWVRDARVRVRGSMGEVGVRVPENVRLNLERVSIGLGEAVKRGLEDPLELPPGTPTLTLDASGSMGELRVTR